MSHSVFGKTMENILKYKNVKLIKKWSTRLGASYHISLAYFHSSHIFDNRSFHFTYISYIVKKLRDKAKLLYVNTDSRIIHFFTDNFYLDMKEETGRFDTSDYVRSNERRKQRLHYASVYLI